MEIPLNSWQESVSDSRKKLLTGRKKLLGCSFVLTQLLERARYKTLNLSFMCPFVGMKFPG